MADAFHLASYPAIAAGLVTLAAAHTKLKDRSAVLDAWIVAVAATLVLWLVLVTASPIDSGMTSLQRGFATAYLGGDVLLLALAVRLLFALRTRTVAMLLLFGSIAVMLVSDVLYAIDDQRLDPAGGGAARACVLVAYSLAGMAGLHHSIADHVEPARPLG